ncbi:hypothetical protein K435DRAFT_821571 [Dendrothele bispora CBS 962.96]|uniref:Programmed cell death protein 2 C-terminal domain-containing protein n=1 Tax=Dendrothele bispora (strain CBS 962.96) TaxID=1314807 RepID=A0A4S8LIH8_DENBC|nr:hypothetical protein K435DRAFT_821571 [Dendrothele bispora CBS 962.96]
MAPQDDWSDSDEELLAGMETSVLLGIPDGVIETESDLVDAAVSRIGGYPAFLPSKEPPFPSSQCKVCSDPMELLVQMWCPFEDSPMDRGLYIWGCSNNKCQRKDGSVRAWRGLRYNDKYAEKLRVKLAKKREREARAQALLEVEKAKQAAKTTNPFSINSSSAPSNLFGLGAQIFGESPSLADQKPLNSEESTEDDISETESVSSEETLLTAMASATLEESPWRHGPAYPALYLSTTSEYIPPPPKSKAPAKDQLMDSVSDDDNKETSWISEAYENSLNVDTVFERFSKRVGYEGEQCVRYDLKGTPLPFASDAAFEALFPAPAAAPLPVTKADFKVVQVPKRSYAPSSTFVPDCPICKGRRVFECQLMPNLINVLKREDGKEKMNEEERRKAVEQALRGGGGKGMEWGTCMVFSCENDCRLGDDGRERKDVWTEEKVIVQWDV